MPTRILRDGINDSRAVNGLSEPAEILYRRLMSVVDDYGRFDADPELIRARCFPRQPERWTTGRVAIYMIELRMIHKVDDDGESIELPPLVTVYRCGLKKFLQINNFGQRVQAKPKYPAPEDEGSLVLSPESTVTSGDSPPRATRAHSESESESKSETYSESNENPCAIAKAIPRVGPSKRNDVAAEVADWYNRDFYPIFPLHKAGSLGLKAAQAKLRTPELREIALAALKAQLPELLAREKEKRPYPASWINAARWEDETLTGLSVGSESGKLNAIEAALVANRIRA